MPEATPISHWIGFHVALFLLLGVELLYSRTSRATVQRKSLMATLLWVGVALAFAMYVQKTLGGQRTLEYLAGYALEEALSIDNLFVFLLLFRLFKVEGGQQPKVLFWGVSGAIVMRGLFIAGGIGLLTRFTWISYAFGALLLVAAIRLVIPEKDGGPESTPVWVRWISRIHPVSQRTDCFFTGKRGIGG